MMYDIFEECHFRVTVKNIPFNRHVVKVYVASGDKEFLAKKIYYKGHYDPDIDNKITTEVAYGWVKIKSKG